MTILITIGEKMSYIFFIQVFVRNCNSWWIDKPPVALWNAVLYH